LGVGAAVDVLEGHARQPLLRQPPQVRDVDDRGRIDPAHAFRPTTLLHRPPHVTCPCPSKEVPVKLTEFFAAQLEREAALSKKALQRVPEGKADWKPHPKSMPLGYLSTLVACMPDWIAMTVDRDELDLKPPSGQGYKPPATDTNAKLLAAHDECVGRGLS